MRRPFSRKRQPEYAFRSVFQKLRRFCELRWAGAEPQGPQIQFCTRVFISLLARRAAGLVYYGVDDKPRPNPPDEQALRLVKHHRQRPGLTPVSSIESSVRGAWEHAVYMLGEPRHRRDGWGSILTPSGRSLPGASAAGAACALAPDPFPEGLRSRRRDRRLDGRHVPPPPEADPQSSGSGRMPAFPMGCSTAAFEVLIARRQGRWPLRSCGQADRRSPDYLVDVFHPIPNQGTGRLCDHVTSVRQGHACHREAHRCQGKPRSVFPF